ncbi:MAG: Hsp20/alpha crystallin family protein [Thermodesulfobacteriota bacterium]|nr:Hsp20/alpha crystallin family protein [Thermodesulfobacteriota bacterium]
MNSIIPWRRKSKEAAGNDSLQQQEFFDRFFREPFGSLMEGSFFPATRELFAGTTALWPDIDVSERRNDITVEVEIPGMDKKDIQLYLDGRVLTIKGEKVQDSESRKRGVFRKERSYGYFNRSVELPADVDANSVSARYKRGVLRIEIKKIKSANQKSIPVKTA